jgi:hypothetical protein
MMTTTKVETMAVVKRMATAKTTRRDAYTGYDDGEGRDGRHVRARP